MFVVCNRVHSLLKSVFCCIYDFTSSQIMRKLEWLQNIALFCKLCLHVQRLGRSSQNIKLYNGMKTFVWLYFYMLLGVFWCFIYMVQLVCGRLLSSSIFVWDPIVQWMAVWDWRLYKLHTYDAFVIQRITRVMLYYQRGVLEIKECHLSIFSTLIWLT